MQSIDRCNPPLANGLGLLAQPNARRSRAAGIERSHVISGRSVRSGILKCGVSPRTCLLGSAQQHIRAIDVGPEVGRARPSEAEQGGRVHAGVDCG